MSENQATFVNSAVMLTVLMCILDVGVYIEVENICDYKTYI